MFDENARGALIQHLGYVPQPEEEAPVETEKPAVDSSITAEDLFAGASPSVPESAVVAEPAREEPEKSEAQDPAAWSSEVKNCIVIGDFGRAVDICFKYGRFADAMMIAMWGGDELMEQTRVGVWGVREE